MWSHSFIILFFQLSFCSCLFVVSFPEFMARHPSCRSPAGTCPSVSQITNPLRDPAAKFQCWNRKHCNGKQCYDLIHCRTTLFFPSVIDNTYLMHHNTSSPHDLLPYSFTDGSTGWENTSDKAWIYIDWETVVEEEHLMRFSTFPK